MTSLLNQRSVLGRESMRPLSVKHNALCVTLKIYARQWVLIPPCAARNTPPQNARPPLGSQFLCVHFDSQNGRQDSCVKVCCALCKGSIQHATWNNGNACLITQTNWRTHGSPALIHCAGGEPTNPPEWYIFFTYIYVISEHSVIIVCVDGALHGCCPCRWRSST